MHSMMKSHKCPRQSLNTSQTNLVFMIKGVLPQPDLTSDPNLRVNPAPLVIMQPSALLVFGLLSAVLAQRCVTQETNKASPVEGAYYASQRQIKKCSVHFCFKKPPSEQILNFIASGYLIGSGDALNVKELKTDERQQQNTNKNSPLLTV